MNENGRIHNSILNLSTGFVFRIISMLSGFIVRTVFIQCLNIAYLSVNGLYSNILTMLSLAELGFGSAMVFSMYQPLAHKDYEKLAQLMQLYKKVYRYIGFVILGLGLCLVPFLDYFIKDKPNIDGLVFYYILFLLNTVTSYLFFAYRNAILNADQKLHIISKVQISCNLLKSGVQILVLLLLHNFTAFLIIQILFTIGENLVLSLRVRKMYPIFQKPPKEKLPKETVKQIFSDVKALMLSRISHVALNGTDNLIISSFVGVFWVGYLSNFTMITDAVTGILIQISAAITGSLGNFFAKEDQEQGYRLFCRLEFLNFWLYSFSAIALVTLMNPFVTLWLGKEFVLSWYVAAAISLNFFVAGLMNTLWVFRSTLGLFTQGKYRPVIVALINIILSISLSYVWGVFGVLFATFLSRAFVSLWYDPWLIHKAGFNKPVMPFFRRYFLRIILIIIIVAMLHAIKTMLFANGVTILNLVAMILITAIIPNSIFLILYHKTDEFKYLQNFFSSYLLKKIKRNRNHH